MNEKILYSISALFNTADEVIHAAEKIAEKGYKKYDVNTPYPVHGMFDAMKLPPSKLGYVSLVFGLSGTIAALLLMTITSVFDYPNIIGGKPFFALPAFVPIMFEVTVLSAAIATVVAMIAFFFKFPNNSHPIHDTDYMKAVSSDKYGIYITTEDDEFDENEIRQLFSDLGAFRIEPIYYDDEELGHDHKIFDKRFLGLLFGLAIIVGGTTYVGLNKLMFMPPFNWMMEQDKGKVQNASTFFSDGYTMRQPVEGTVARDKLPYPYKGKPEEAAKKMINPLIVSKSNLELGKDKYDIYCSPCHGYVGKGESRLRGQFPNPPSLHSVKLRNWSDGRIYHVIMDGQNVMPSYSSQLTRQERWAVVLYVRALQRSLNAKESDLK